MKEYKVSFQTYIDNEMKAFIKFDLQKNLGTMELETYDYYDEDYGDDKAKILFSLGFNVDDSWVGRVKLHTVESPNKKNHTDEVYLKLRDKNRQMGIEQHKLRNYFSNETEIKELILRTIIDDINIGILSLLPDTDTSYQILNASFKIGEIKIVEKYFEVKTVHPSSWKLWYVQYLNQPNSTFKESWNCETKEFDSLEQVKEYVAERWFATWLN